VGLPYGTTLNAFRKPDRPIRIGGGSSTVLKADPADQRSHRMGPAVFGKIPLGNRQAIRYNAAWLLGASTNAPSQTFRMQVEYEF